MNGIRSLATRINAILLLVIAGLALGLALAWDYYATRKSVGYDKTDYAAELLAHGLPHESAGVLQEIIDSDPFSTKNIKLRKVLADIYMNKIGDYEKALGELVFIRTSDPSQASATEDGIKRCMDRLGRVYDVQRRMMISQGRNPIENTVSSATAIRLGNEEVVSVAELQRRVAQLGLPLKDPPKDVLAKVVQGLASELLLRRASKRAQVDRQPQFLEQVRQFEENLSLQKYLEDHVLKDVKVDEQALTLYLEQNKSEFNSPLRVVYSILSFPDENSGRAFVAGTPIASAPKVIADHVNSLADELPGPLKGIAWDTEPAKGSLGPVEINGSWMVYPIHEVVPARKVAPDLARQQARLKLLEQKQSGKLSETINELAQKEELKILDEVIQSTFYPNASGTSDTTATPMPK